MKLKKTKTCGFVCLYTSLGSNEINAFCSLYMEAVISLFSQIAISPALLFSN